MDSSSRMSVEVGAELNSESFNIVYDPKVRKGPGVYIEEDQEFMRKEFADFDEHCPYSEMQHLKNILYVRLGPRYMAWLRYVNKKYHVPQRHIIEKLIDQVRSSGELRLG